MCTCINTYMVTHTKPNRPSYLSFLFNLHIIIPKSCSLPPQIDFDSSSSWRCKSEILPHAVVYVLENSVLKIPISWCYALNYKFVWKGTNSDHLQHRDICWLSQNTNMETWLLGFCWKSKSAGQKWRRWIL